MGRKRGATAAFETGHQEQEHITAASTGLGAGDGDNTQETSVDGTDGTKGHKARNKVQKVTKDQTLHSGPVAPLDVPISRDGLLATVRQLEVHIASFVDANREKHDAALRAETEARREAERRLAVAETEAAKVATYEAARDAAQEALRVAREESEAAKTAASVAETTVAIYKTKYEEREERNTRLEAQLQVANQKVARLKESGPSAATATAATADARRQQQGKKCSTCPDLKARIASLEDEVTDLQDRQTSNVALVAVKKQAKEAEEVVRLKYEAMMTAAIEAAGEEAVARIAELEAVIDKMKHDENTDKKTAARIVELEDAMADQEAARKEAAARIAELEAALADRDAALAKLEKKEASFVQVNDVNDVHDVQIPLVAPAPPPLGPSDFALDRPVGPTVFGGGDGGPPTEENEVLDYDDDDEDDDASAHSEHSEDDGSGDGEDDRVFEPGELVCLRLIECVNGTYTQGHNDALRTGRVAALSVVRANVPKFFSEKISEVLEDEDGAGTDVTDVTGCVLYKRRGATSPSEKEWFMDVLNGRLTGNAAGAEFARAADLNIKIVTVGLYLDNDLFVGSYSKGERKKIKQNGLPIWPTLCDEPTE